MYPNPETWYHGSSKQFTGFIFVDDRDRTDAGDLGYGIYFTKVMSRAKCYGVYRYQCQIDMTHIADVPDAYRLFEKDPVDGPSKLFRALAFDHVGGTFISSRANKVWEKASQEYRDTYPDFWRNRTRIVRPGAMKTCNNMYCFEEKIEASKRIRDAFLDAGYAGLLACNKYGPDDDDDCIERELVVFDLEAIVSISEIELPDVDNLGWGY